MSIAIATMGMFRPAGTGGGTIIVEKIVEVAGGGGYSGLGVDDKRKPQVSASLYMEKKTKKHIEVYDISEE